MNTTTLAETIAMLIYESGDTEVMETILFFVRHAESAFVEGKERTRGLSIKGQNDAKAIKEVLRYEDIDVFISSPYERAIETIRPTAINYQNDIQVEEDLRERTIGDFTPATFAMAKYRVYEDIQLAFPDGESSEVAQQRASSVILRILDIHKGKKIVIGTHGDIMTLILNYFDKQYEYTFWQSTSMPDIYKVRFKGSELIEVIRLWE
ncbi:histidine phosphatase family protein [Gorillibacterium massiliense]|uniref:histidine phosphatase family protein n=1 Tax=Gorillibacterium massiliense TaxID=1280390 RepID=UPI001EE340FB|nr:histidine phosphatase family protein [Gorillibacterium massiliense]